MEIFGVVKKKHMKIQEKLFYDLFLKKIHKMDENIGRIIKRCISTDEKKNTYDTNRFKKYIIIYIYMEGMVSGLKTSNVKRN